VGVCEDFGPILEMVGLNSELRVCVCVCVLLLLLRCGHQSIQVEQSFGLKVFKIIYCCIVDVVLTYVWGADVFLSVPLVCLTKLVSCPPTYFRLYITSFPSRLFLQVFWCVVIRLDTVINQLYIRKKVVCQR
jgi:hypothetical protein